MMAHGMWQQQQQHQQHQQQQHHHHQQMQQQMPPSNWGGGYAPPPPMYGAPPPFQPYGGGQGMVPGGAPVFPPPQRGPSRFEDCKSLWIGEIQPSWNEDYVRGIFKECNKRFNVKLVRDRVTQAPSGYGFLEFDTHADAEGILNEYSDKPIPGTPFACNLRWGGGHGRTSSNWTNPAPPQQLQQPPPPHMMPPPPQMPGSHASGGPSGYSGAPQPPRDWSIFVGDLDYNVTEKMLHDKFAGTYNSVLTTKLVMDMTTGLSKGFGFVKFGSEQDRDRAMSEMHGQYVGERPVRCTLATTREEREREQKIQTDQRQQDPARLMSYSANARTTEEGENTCVFVGGLDESVTPDMLRHHFGLLGDIAYIRIPPGRGCGFVGFVHRKNAEAAISTLQGLRINGYKVRLSWGSMRQGPKGAQNQRAGQQLAAARAASSTGRPISQGASRILQGSTLTQMVTQQKRDHKTPYGAITNDFSQKDLQDPRAPWTNQPKPILATAEEKKKQRPSSSLKKPSLAGATMSTYTATLKARFDAYMTRIPAGAATTTKKSKKEKAEAAAASSAKRQEEEDDEDIRPPGFTSRLSRVMGKRPLTVEETEADNDSYVRKFLKPTIFIAEIPTLHPPPPVDPKDHIRCTAMELYMEREAKGEV